MVAVGSEVDRLAIILDNANQFTPKSIASLIRTLKVNKNARLMLLSCEDLDEGKIGYCDKLRIGYDSKLIELIGENSPIFTMCQKEVVDFILETSKCVPSEAGKIASMIRGDHKVNHRKEPADLEKAKEVLENWRGGS